jgi:hypothetical protein
MRQRRRGAAVVAQLAGAAQQLLALEGVAAALEAPYLGECGAAGGRAPAAHSVAGVRGLRAATVLRLLVRHHLELLGQRRDLGPTALEGLEPASASALRGAAGSAAPGLGSAAAVAAAVLALPGLQGAASSALLRNEMELLQLHVARCLARPPPGAGAGTGAEARLQRLLMADWVSLNVRHPLLRADALLSLAAGEYAAQGVPAPLGCPPSREVVKLHAGPGGAVEAAVLGGPLESARSTVCLVGGAQLELPRCSATLRVCTSTDAWHCSVCERRCAFRGATVAWGWEGEGIAHPSPYHVFLVSPPW